MTFRVVVIPDVVEKGDVQKVRHLEAVDETIAEEDRIRRLLVELAARRPHGEGAGGDPHQLVYCGGDGRVRAGQLKRVHHPGSRAGTAARNAAPPWGRRPSVRETDDARGGSRDRVSHDLDAQKVETRRRQVALFVEAIPGQIVVPRPALLFEPAHGTPP